MHLEIEVSRLVEHRRPHHVGEDLPTTQLLRDGESPDLAQDPVLHIVAGAGSLDEIQVHHQNDLSLHLHDNEA